MLREFESHLLRQSNQTNKERRNEMTVEKAVRKILKDPSARPTINHRSGNFSIRIGELNREEAIILMLDGEDITGITTPRNFDSLCAWISDRIDGHGTRYRYAKPIRG